MEQLEKFIVFEGLDGAGTTTQAELLSEYLKGTGNQVFLTCEPTDGCIGRLIRRILSGEETVTPRSLALLYAADRDDHLFGKEGILCAAAEGKFIISDRYFYSSLAYQSIGSDYEDVRQMNSSYPPPSIIFYIDTPVSECMRRIENNRDSKDIFEHESFLSRVYTNYEHALRDEETGRSSVFRIDGTLGIDEIHQQVIRYLDQSMSIASP